MARMKDEVGSECGGFWNALRPISAPTHHGRPFGLQMIPARKADNPRTVSARLRQGAGQFRIGSVVTKARLKQSCVIQPACREMALAFFVFRY
jgi:hypothetical protein